MTLAHLPILLGLLASSDVTVTSARSDRANASFARLLTLDRPTDRTLETLRRHDLAAHATGFRRNIPYVIGQLETAVQANREADLLYALAELAWIEARHQDYRHKGEALDRYLDAASYAHEFLLGPGPGAAGPPSSDPRFRDACSLYNGSVDRLLREALSNPGRFETEGTVGLKVHGKEKVLRIVMDPAKTPWRFADVDQVFPCADFDVAGLPSVYQYGVGVPLVAVRKSDRSATGPEKFYPAEMTFALTAYLEPGSKLGQGGEAVLRLIDPVKEPTVGAGPLIAVESDLTTPLAYMWSKTDLTHYQWSGLLRPEQNIGRAGLTLIRPYEPGKIPVVMVHGLASTPLAWIPMLNDLLRDPRVQQRYQFMLYLYPTGVPFPIAAAGLRETLQEAEKTFSPGGSDPEFSRMVLVGHSMGGLLSHAMVVESGDHFWQLNSDQDFKRIAGHREVVDELKRYMFFSPLPFVRRVVFLGTPHRGSDYSRSVVGRVGAGLINDSDHVAKLLLRLVKDNPDAFNRKQFRRMPTSIETLATNGDMLLALLAMKPGPDVAFHSIIGSLRPGPRRESTDGVVPYVSSHLDGVASELVVRSDHGVQRSGPAIEEVRRILLEHVGIMPPGVAAGRATAAPR